MGIPDSNHCFDRYTIVVGLNAVERIESDWLSIRFSAYCDTAPGQRTGAHSFALFKTFFSDNFQFRIELEQVRQGLAEDLYKTIKGVSKPPNLFWSASVAHPDQPDRRVRMIAKYLPGAPRTILGGEMAAVLGIPVSTSGGHRAFVQVLARKFFIDVLTSSVITVPLIIGEDLVAQATHGRTEPWTEVSDLFLDEAVKAHRARCAAKENTVLLIGSFTAEGKNHLYRIDCELVRLGYSPVMIDDFKGDEASLETKMLSFALISKFVIYESSIPSGAIDELKICKDNGIIVAKLNEVGRDSTSMQSHYERDCTHIKFFTYDALTFRETIGCAVEWAEKIVAERRKKG